MMCCSLTVNYLLQQYIASPQFTRTSCSGFMKKYIPHKVRQWIAWGVKGTITLDHISILRAIFNAHSENTGFAYLKLWNLVTSFYEPLQKNKPSTTETNFENSHELKLTFEAHSVTTKNTIRSLMNARSSTINFTNNYQIFGVKLLALAFYTRAVYYIFTSFNASNDKTRLNISAAI
jgi:hypothetical protein